MLYILIIIAIANVVSVINNILIHLDNKKSGEANRKFMAARKEFDDVFMEKNIRDGLLEKERHKLSMKLVSDYKPKVTVGTFHRAWFVSGTLSGTDTFTRLESTPWFDSKEAVEKEYPARELFAWETKEV